MFYGLVRLQMVCIGVNERTVTGMAEWRVYEADTPQCTHCGMWMPFARYRRRRKNDE